MLTMNNIPSFILSSSHRTAPSATWEIFSFLIFCNKGSFNNYATLKLPFFDPPIPHHQVSSQMITRPTLKLRQG